MENIMGISLQEEMPCPGFRYLCVTLYTLKILNNRILLILYKNLWGKLTVFFGLLWVQVTCTWIVCNFIIGALIKLTLVAKFPFFRNVLQSIGFYLVFQFHWFCIICISFSSSMWNYMYQLFFLTFELTQAISFLKISWGDCKKIIKIWIFKITFLWLFVY